MKRLEGPGAIIVERVLELDAKDIEAGDLLLKWDATAVQYAASHLNLPPGVGWTVTTVRHDEDNALTRVWCRNGAKLRFLPFGWVRVHRTVEVTG